VEDWLPHGRGRDLCGAVVSPSSQPQGHPLLLPHISLGGHFGGPKGTSVVTRNED
jgi:hypothetical protein